MKNKVIIRNINIYIGTATPTPEWIINEEETRRGKQSETQSVAKTIMNLAIKLQDDPDMKSVSHILFARDLCKKLKEKETILDDGYLYLFKDGSVLILIKDKIFMPHE